MNYIKGKFRNIIYQNNDNGYYVAVFRIKETNDPKMQDYLNRSITITGTFFDLNYEELFILFGEGIKHDKFGFQYRVLEYKKEELTNEDAIVEFLSSSLIKGCGSKTAKRIVKALGVDAINKIKEDEEALLGITGINSASAKKIRESVIKLTDASDTLIKLKEMGFTINEATNIYNKYKEDTKIIIDSNLYALSDIIDFNKIDLIFKKDHEEYDGVRIKALLIEAMKFISTKTGDTYYLEEEIYDVLKTEFNLLLDDIMFNDAITILEEEEKIIIEDNIYYLREYYDNEVSIIENLYSINNKKINRVDKIEEELFILEQTIHVKYNEEQKKAIKNALENKITLISGGPGTGKTTIINAIVKLYSKLHNYSRMQAMNDIALLAPTGRASKKMSLSTDMPAMTVHRFLKWNKDTNSFGVNEFQKENQKLIIVDEMSMIDLNLFAALLKGIRKSVQLVLVGDVFQLPSVGAGLVLKDLIDSEIFTYCALVDIYRQSNNSYIPYLALEIKNKRLSDDFINKKDDYNFIETDSVHIKEMIKKICLIAKEKGLNEIDLQVLAPMYRGDNGIDNLNILLQDVYNPRDAFKLELKVGDIIFRENDKILQLQNNPDCNVYNGDIGYIRKIYKNEKDKDVILIDFEGNKVEYLKEDMYQIKHAYAISIHKSQGSEFSHVIIPVCKGYYKMLYNKLIYTGVSRAKKSLILIGDSISFYRGVQNDYASTRKTRLKEKLIKKFITVFN